MRGIGSTMKGAAAVGMQAMHVQITSSGEAPGVPRDECEPVRIDDIRLDQLARWHGTDEANLPPAHTLQNLSRDTVAALEELREARATIQTLRAAMGEAFLATEFRQVHEILLTALGPPPDDLHS